MKKKLSIILLLLLLTPILTGCGYLEETEWMLELGTWKESAFLTLPELKIAMATTAASLGALISIVHMINALRKNRAFESEFNTGIISALIAIAIPNVLGLAVTGFGKFFFPKELAQSFALESVGIAIPYTGDTSIITTGALLYIINAVPDIHKMIQIIVWVTLTCTSYVLIYTNNRSVLMFMAASISGWVFYPLILYNTLSSLAQMWPSNAIAATISKFNFVAIGSILATMGIAYFFLPLGVFFFSFGIYKKASKAAKDEAKKAYKEWRKNKKNGDNNDTEEDPEDPNSKGSPPSPDLPEDMEPNFGDFPEGGDPEKDPEIIDAEFTIDVEETRRSKRKKKRAEKKEQVVDAAVTAAEATNPELIPVLEATRASLKDDPSENSDEGPDTSNWVEIDLGEGDDL